MHSRIKSLLICRDTVCRKTCRQVMASVLAVGALLSVQFGHAGKAKDQLDRAQHQSGRVTFDGAKPKANPVKGKTNKRTPQQAIKDYRDSAKTTEREKKAIEAYKKSGKSRSGK